MMTISFWLGFDVHFICLSLIYADTKSPMSTITPDDCAVFGSIWFHDIIVKKNEIDCFSILLKVIFEWIFPHLIKLILADSIFIVIEHEFEFLLLDITLFENFSRFLILLVIRVFEHIFSWWVNMVSDFFYNLLFLILFDFLHIFKFFSQLTLKNCDGMVETTWNVNDFVEGVLFWQW